MKGLKTACLIQLGSALRLTPKQKIAADVLPSWNDTPAKSAIVTFVSRVTRRDDRHFVPPDERIAVFDDDGTLWAEQPLYMELLFALDRLRARADSHPEWRTRAPYAALLRGEVDAALAADVSALEGIVAATHADLTTDEFRQVVYDWLASAHHPKLHRPYTELVYQPMLELLRYFAAHEFKTFIVSGGGVEFVRIFAERVCAIPPERVIGSRGRLRLEYRDGRPSMRKLSTVDFVHDGAGKPIAIAELIGRQPIVAVGNSDGDLPMLDWTAAHGYSLCLLVHHTDGRREWAYDCDARVGRLERGLAKAQARGWTVVDMQRDFRRVFAGRSRARHGSRAHRQSNTPAP